MRARITTPFSGAEDGTLHPRWIETGEIVTGSLAEIAVRENWAEEIGPEPAEGRTPPRRKAASR